MNKKGVTLIELIVVMVIIGIGAVLFAPNIGAFLPSYRLRSAARDIVSTMRTAQMKAVSTNLNYRVSFTKTPPTYTLQYEQPKLFHQEFQFLQLTYPLETMPYLIRIQLLLLEV
jgi:prepilin-type N-terminal cleavage/methylation domain-containing protein